MPLSSLVTLASRKAAIFACSLVASLALAGSQQATAAPSAAPSITAGYDYSCGVTPDGGGLCWGTDNNGKLTVPTGKSWASIRAGWVHTCGVTTTGEGLCWGSNSVNQTEVPTGKTWASISPGNEPGNYHSCGVTTTGVGFCWGSNSYGQTDVPTGKTWALISPGQAFTCGVTTTGEGFCWGSSYQSRTAIPTGKTWATIDAGIINACGVTTAGEGICWGANGGRNDVPAGKTWSSISPGMDHTCGLTTSGEAICWADASHGKTSVPAGKTWAQVDAGYYHTCGVTTSGEGICWGYDGSVASEQQTDYCNTYDTYYRYYDGGRYGPYIGSCNNYHSFWTDPVPADGRLDVPSGAFDAGSVDIVAPAAPTVSAAPSSPTNSTTASFTISGEANASFDCEIYSPYDNGGAVPCTSPKSFTGLRDGTYLFSVTQTDEAGNTSAATQRTWTVDATAPAAPALTGVPSANGTRTTATIGINGERDATLLCSVDGAAYSFCASPLELSGLAVGDHVVLVKQTDEAGNTGPLASAE